MQNFSRRQFMQFGLSALALVSFPLKTLASTAPVKELSFYNLHTGEKLRVAYFEQGRYVNGALAELSHFMRDFRTGDTHTMNPALFDQLHELQHRMESKNEFHVISGYRSPKTNHALHEHSSGVANKSLHMQGCAIDIRLPGRELSALHKAALSMNAGGVGYYPGSDFVHIDTGRQRHWG